VGMQYDQNSKLVKLSLAQIPGSIELAMGHTMPYKARLRGILDVPRVGNVSFHWPHHFYRVNSFALLDGHVGLATIKHSIHALSVRLVCVKPGCRCHALVIQGTCGFARTLVDLALW
jgi:hypothetical protein